MNRKRLVAPEWIIGAFWFKLWMGSRCFVTGCPIISLFTGRKSLAGKSGEEASLILFRFLLSWAFAGLSDGRQMCPRIIQKQKLKNMRSRSQQNKSRQSFQKTCTPTTAPLGEEYQWLLFMHVCMLIHAEKFKIDTPCTDPRPQKGQNNKQM